MKNWKPKNWKTSTAAALGFVIVGALLLGYISVEVAVAAGGLITSLGLHLAQDARAKDGTA